MPFRTQYGSHYHMTQGCHGADILCGTEGLEPCADCCGRQGGGGDDSAGLLGGSGMGGDSGAYSADSYLKNDKEKDFGGGDSFVAVLEDYLQNGTAGHGYVGNVPLPQGIAPTHLTDVSALLSRMSPSAEKSMPAAAGMRWRQEALYRRIASDDAEIDRVLDEYEDALRTRCAQGATEDAEEVSEEVRRWNDRYRKWLASDPLHSPDPDAHVSKADIDEEAQSLAREEGLDWSHMSADDRARVARAYQPEIMRRIFHDQQMGAWINQQLDEDEEGFARQVAQEIGTMLDNGEAVEWQGRDISDPSVFTAALLMTEGTSGENARRGGTVLQRRMRMSYARAQRVVDTLEEVGVISPVFDEPASGGGYTVRRRQLMSRGEMIRSFVKSGPVAKGMFAKSHPDIVRHREAQSQGVRNEMGEIRRRASMMKEMRPQGGDEEAMRDFAITLSRGFDALR